MRARPYLSAIVIATAIVLVVGACAGGDDDDDKPTPSPPASETPFDDGGGTPPASPGQLPPEFVRCMARQGFDIRSSGDIHTAPPQVLQACFGALHQGGG